MENEKDEFEADPYKETITAEYDIGRRNLGRQKGIITSLEEESYHRCKQEVSGIAHHSHRNDLASRARECDFEEKTLNNKTEHCCRTLSENVFHGHLKTSPSHTPSNILHIETSECLDAIRGYSPIKKIRNQYSEFSHSNDESDVNNWREALHKLKSNILRNPYRKQVIEMNEEEGNQGKAIWANDSKRNTSQKRNGNKIPVLKTPSQDLSSKDILKFPLVTFNTKTDINKSENEVGRKNLNKTNVRPPIEVKREFRKKFDEPTYLNSAIDGKTTVNGRKTRIKEKKLELKLLDVGTYDDFVSNMMPSRQYSLQREYNRDIENVDSYKHFKSGIRSRRCCKLLGINCSLLIAGNLNVEDEKCND